jgi:hypothetical protein
MLGRCGDLAIRRRSSGAYLRRSKHWLLVPVFSSGLYVKSHSACSCRLSGCIYIFHEGWRDGCDNFFT